MTTELYLVNDKNDFSKSFYALISTRDLINKRQTQIMPLKKSPLIPFYIETDFIVSLETLNPIILSQISLKINCDVVIKKIDFNLSMFLKEKFKSLIDEILNKTIDVGLEKSLLEIM